MFEEWKVKKVTTHATLKSTADPQLTDIVASLGASGKPKGTSPAIEMWQKKLEHLLLEQAKTSDAAAKFSIEAGIEEARRKIAELRGDT